MLDDSIESDSSNSNAQATTPLCVICDQAAIGVGPFSRCHLCQQHLSVDIADVQKLKKEVAEELHAYSQHSAGSVAAEEKAIQKQLEQTKERLVTVQRDLLVFSESLTGQFQAQLEAVRSCKRDIEDVESYKQEVATAEVAGQSSQVVYLVESMQLSLEGLQSDFERAARLKREESDRLKLQLQRLQQLERLVGIAVSDTDPAECASDAAVSVRPEMIDAAVEACGSFDAATFSHEVKMDGPVGWLTVCFDTRGFVSDHSGRVVPAVAGSSSKFEALPEPCIFTIVGSSNYLMVLSVDGTRRLRCYCELDWKNYVCGLHCDLQLLFVAQNKLVTVTDISGLKLREIRPENINSFGDISGIGGRALTSVFVSSGNKIAAFNKANGQMETVVTISHLPDANLGNLVIENNCILVADRKKKQVYRVRIDTQQLVATHPNHLARLVKFAEPWDIAVDSRGRLFVSEFSGHSVRALDANDGSLLWTFGTPGESGSGDCRLKNPCSVAVLHRDTSEYLVVADCGNKRLLVFNLV